MKLAIKLKITAATTNRCYKSCKTFTTVAALISIIFLAANDGVPSVQAIIIVLPCRRVNEDGGGSQMDWSGGRTVRSHWLQEKLC